MSAVHHASAEPGSACVTPTKKPGPPSVRSEPGCPGAVPPAYARPMTSSAGTPSTPEALFSNSPEGLELCQVVRSAILSNGPAVERTTTSQVAFRNRRGFAYVWNPRQHLKTDVPAVLSIALPRHIVSARFKEVVHPSPGIWMHHLELLTPHDVDSEVTEWLREAFDAAG